MLFRSMTAAQFRNWTEVLVIIGGSDRAPRRFADMEKFDQWL
jgi:hypothetical protein